MSDEQAKRVGLNESIFRQVNEQIESLNRSFGGDAPRMTIICECASADCTDRFEVPVAEYEKVRGDPRRFIIAPGHELPGYESIVERADGYDVLEKREGAPAALAEETDPRS